jgi:cytochrome P450
MSRPTETLDRDFGRYGDLYSIKNPLFGVEVVVAHPALIKQIFTGDPGVLHGGEPNKNLAVVLGDRSVLLLDGREHHRQRKLLLPPFHGERLAVYTGVLRELSDRMIDGLPIGREIPLLPRLQGLTFDVILRTVFGVSEGDAIDTLRERLLAIVEKAMSPTGMLWLLPAFQRDLGPLTGWASFKRAIAAADEAIYGIIAEARRAGGGSGRSDVLSLLLSAVDEEGGRMSDQELRDELITLLLAGHESTATALAWAVEDIARRPEVLERILGEIAAAPPGGPLPYLDATIKEVLRLRPIASLVVRRTTAPITLREYEIPAGTYLVVNVYTAQRHPDFWEAPSELRPERFLDPARKPDPYAWMPFGGGARRCIGMAFALLEMRVVLAALLSRVRLRLPRGPARVALRSFLFAPEGGTRVVVEERRAA